jgi:hypothetical protein
MVDRQRVGARLVCGTLGAFIPTRSNAAPNELIELSNQVRTLKRIFLGVFGVVVLGGLLAATNLQRVPDVIQAKKFEVVNGEGKVVAGLGSDEVNGGGVLGINNKDGNIVSGIFASEDGGVVRVLNNTFTEVVRIDAGNNGHGQSSVSDKDGKQFARIWKRGEGHGGCPFWGARSSSLDRVVEGVSRGG